MDAKKQESGEARRRSNALMKRLALRGGDTFVVFKDIKISLVPKALGIGFSRYFGIGRCKKEKRT